jgi:hypothetical protein
VISREELSCEMAVGKNPPCRHCVWFNELSLIIQGEMVLRVAGKELQGESCETRRSLTKSRLLDEQQ